MQAYGELEVEAHTFSTSTLDCTPQDKGPLHLLNGMLGGPQGQSEHFGVGGGICVNPLPLLETSFAHNVNTIYVQDS